MSWILRPSARIVPLPNSGSSVGISFILAITASAVLGLRRPRPPSGSAARRNRRRPGPWSASCRRAARRSAWTRRGSRRSGPSRRLSVSTRPCAVWRPSAWTSVMKTSSPASFWPPWVMPNSAACLIELMVSPPALASPITLRRRPAPAAGRTRSPWPGNGCAHGAEHLAAGCLDDRGGVALQRVAEGVVGGEEEPAVAALLDHGAAGAVGERIGVVGPVDGVGRAGLAGQVGGAGAGVEEDLVLLAW